MCVCVLGVERAISETGIHPIDPAFLKAGFPLVTGMGCVKSKYSIWFLICISGELRGIRRSHKLLMR